MEQIVIGEAANGLSKLWEVGPVVIVLILVLIAALFIGKFLINKATEMFNAAIQQCEQREKRAIENWEKANERGVEALMKNSESHKELSISIARLEAKLDK